MTGRVVTFYSYKGGVGRSFAVANVAVVLAQWGHRVLAVDWDIEAPGLNHYFPGLTSRTSAGVIDFLDDCRNGRPLRWDSYVVPLDIPGVDDKLKLMTAQGDRDRDYARLVQELDWDRLYRLHGLGAKMEALRAQWVEHFDFVLVDSRTGVTDFSGLTTVQLPDVLAFMFTANQQSLTGCTEIVRRAMEARRSMPVDRPALLPLPIPARFEQREEYELAQLWRRHFAGALEPAFAAWAPAGIDTLKLIDLLTIPYVPRWTFGEELAVLIEPSDSSGVRSASYPVSFACETIAALLVHGFAHVDLLTSSRDEFVHAARRRGVETAQSAAKRDHPVIYAYAGASDWCEKVLAMLEKGVRLEAMQLVGYRETGLRGDLDRITRQRRISAADAYMPILDDKSDVAAMAHEVKWMQRSALRSDIALPIIPVVHEQAEFDAPSRRPGQLSPIHPLRRPKPWQPGRWDSRLSQASAYPGLKQQHRRASPCPLERRHTPPIGRSARAQDELVAVGIAEGRERAPGLLLRRRVELDAALAQLAVGGLDVVASEGAVEEAADPLLLAVGREQHEAGVAAADLQLDPALRLAERLVGHQSEADLLGPEFERPVLVAGRDADELDVGDHVNGSLVRAP